MFVKLNLRKITINNKKNTKILGLKISYLNFFKISLKTKNKGIFVFTLFIEKYKNICA